MKTPTITLASLLLFSSALAGFGATSALAQVPPRIAVTDLAYQEKVSGYFSTYRSRETVDSRSSSRERLRESDFGVSTNSSSRDSSRSERSVDATSGYRISIDRGELRRFTSDIRGELIRSGAYRVTEGRPWTQTNTESLFDIVGRIRRGFYPGADYVLFGSINEISLRSESSPIQGTNATNHSLAMDLVADFALVDTRSLEVKAAFTASGSGSDARLVNLAGQAFALNRAKVMQEVSRSLGQAVAAELGAQAPDARDAAFVRERSESVRSRETTIVDR